jgi:16S rRNA (adenine1518-N6/adenine1519-N6)-dimethyltransferase
VSGQASLARLREFGIRPDRDLGQNFLVDDNILAVAGRLVGLVPEDVAIEVGAGLGVLTAWLADRVSLVHAVEVDRRLEPALRQTIGDRGNVDLRFADALAVDLAALHPPPTVMVANLPYSVATPVVMEALPHVARFCVMVQREIAERFFASPGSKSYAAVSVLLQIACTRIGKRPVSRSVFVPQPNVDSALVAFERRPDAVFDERWPRLVRLVQGAFAHRRKTLANALPLAGLPSPPADVAGLRAEALPPGRFLRLLDELDEP